MCVCVLVFNRCTLQFVCLLLEPPGLPASSYSQSNLSVKNEAFEASHTYVRAFGVKRDSSPAISHTHTQVLYLLSIYCELLLLFAEPEL